MSPEQSAESRVGRMLEQVRAAATVKQVFGDPITQGEVTLLPVAAVRGALGGGLSEEGTGGGFAVTARPVGVYQMRGDEVTWVPAADTTRVIALGQAVAIVTLLVLRSILGRRRHR
jgi:uncharacterized spore protein YtfJ